MRTKHYFGFNISRIYGEDLARFDQYSVVILSVVVPKDGYIVFILLFVRSYVHSFVRSFVCTSVTTCFG